MPDGTQIGRAARRKEDDRLIVGQGRFSDDLNLPEQVYAAFVRSPHAHADILSIDRTAALASPGVLAFLTGADVAADGLNPVPHNPAPTGGLDVELINRDGSDLFAAPQMPLTADRARFVGDAVAMVVAETPALARDAAERVSVDYRPLPAVTGSKDACAPDAPRLWPQLDSNVCIDADIGDQVATETAFGNAAHVIEFDTLIDRATGVPMEPRAAIGVYDAGTDRYTLHAGSGGVVRQKRELAVILGVDIDSVRVVCHDVGGNFGTRNAFYPEFALVVWASRRLGRPVKWTCDRSEAFLSDYQGRDLTADARLGLDESGKIVALDVTLLSNIGAYTVSVVPLMKSAELLTGVYRVPVSHVHAFAVFSNKPPTNPYRSAGRPEAMFVIERLLDLAAEKLDLDPVELRRRNLVSSADMPYANRLGMTYDSGDYVKNMDLAVDLGDLGGFPARRSGSGARGRLRGLGLANYVESCTGAPRERAEIEVRPDGGVELVVGTLSSGQGHETSFAQVVADWLGVPFESVNMVAGDTDIVSVGGGSHSGRSMRLAGIVMVDASEKVIERGRHIAAAVLEAAETDIEFAVGTYRVAGTDRALGIFEAAAAAATDDVPADLRGPLRADAEVVVTVPAFPSGCHVCEVEVDPDTGEVEIVRYAAIDDVGTVINPLIVEGQVHGGIVQGVGQAMGELCAYQPETGQLLTGSFMDYVMPRADTVPSFDLGFNEIPSPTNRLGVRSAGEGGTTPSLAVVVRAVADALKDYGVNHLEMPLTPERVWRAIRDGA